MTNEYESIRFSWLMLSASYVQKKITPRRSPVSVAISDTLVIFAGFFLEKLMLAGEESRNPNDQIKLKNPMQTT
jgi:hypothetical protein